MTDSKRETFRGVENPEHLDAASDELVVAEMTEAVLEKLR